MIKIIKKYLTSNDYLILVMLTIIVIVSSFLAIWPVMLIKNMVDLAFSKDISNVNMIFKLGLLYLLAHVFTALLKSLGMYITDFLQYKTGFNIQTSVYEKMLKMKLINAKDSTEVVNKVVEDVDYIIHNLFRPYQDILYSVLTFLFGLYFMLSINPILTIIIIPLGLTMAFISKLVSDKSEQNTKKKRDSSEKLWKTFIEGVRGIIPIRLHSIKNEYMVEVRRDGLEYKEVGKKQSKINAISYFSASSLYMVTIGMILIGSSYFVLKGDMSVGSLTAISMYNHMLVEPLINMLYIQQNIIKLRVSSDRINDLLDEKDLLDENEEYGPVDEISVHEVGFSYSENETILSDINFTLRKGSKLVIVGETGAGKSTLATILSGILKCKTGSISYYSRGYKVDYRPKVGHLFQDGYIFDRSIKDNIELLNPDISLDEYNKIIKISMLEEVINTHGDGTIGENGSKLSGGEKKRLRLARALAKKDSDIFIFDELSSSLDKYTCETIFKNIITNYSDKILIFIEHSESVISKFEKRDTLILKKNR